MFTYPEGTSFHAGGDGTGGKSGPGGEGTENIKNEPWDRPSRKARVLVVDDDRFSRKMLEDLLPAWGIDVASIDHGDHAMERVTRCPAPDLVLLDICLPGTSGLEILRLMRLLPATENVPVMVMTAMVGKDIHDLAMATGASAFMLKPFRMNDLRQALDMLLRRELAEG